ncbi:hypothetical protein ACFLTE_02280 [Bacteroidota bacterium]
MVLFKAYDENVEINGQTVLAIVNAFPDHFKKEARNILAENGIVDPVPGQWYSQQKWLDTFKFIAEKFGDNTLFSIGKQIPKNAIFPEESMTSFKEALESINIAYHMNHRNGEIGYYKLLEFDEINSIITFECKNPYPSEFDKGILTRISRDYSYGNVVSIDRTKPIREKGGESTTYIIRKS